MTEEVDYSSAFIHSKSTEQKCDELQSAIVEVRQGLEDVRTILASLLVMQKVIGATVEGLLDILIGKGLIYQSEVDAINDDITEAIGADFAGR